MKTGTTGCNRPPLLPTVQVRGRSCVQGDAVRQRPGGAGLDSPWALMHVHPNRTWENRAESRGRPLLVGTPAPPSPGDVHEHLFVCNVPNKLLEDHAKLWRETSRKTHSAHFSCPSLAFGCSVLTRLDVAVGGDSFWPWASPSPGAVEGGAGLCQGLFHVQPFTFSG